MKGTSRTKKNSSKLLEPVKEKESQLATNQAKTKISKKNKDSTLSQNSTNTPHEERAAELERKLKNIKIKSPSPKKTAKIIREISSDEFDGSFLTRRRFRYRLFRVNYPRNRRIDKKWSSVRKTKWWM